jgi:hypothetical protein
MVGSDCVSDVSGRFLMLMLPLRLMLMLMLMGYFGEDLAIRISSQIEGVGEGESRDTRPWRVGRTSVEIPCSVEAIRDGCCANCGSLGSVAFPSDSRVPRFEKSEFWEVDMD